jgi:hypothetical protein
MRPKVPMSSFYFGDQLRDRPKRHISWTDILTKSDLLAYVSHARLKTSGP